MNKMDFANYVYSFFIKYLPSQRGLSSQTITSYSYSLTLFYQYCYSVKNIRQEKLTLDKISKTLIEDFISWLEIERKNSASTRNQRLSALKSLFLYIQSESVINTALCRDILSIPEKKTPVNPPKYLTVAETEVLFAMPDIQTKQGRRDLTLLLLLYDTGARAGELIELKGGDVVFGNNPTIKLFGKGRKTRVVPIMPKTADILRGYMRENSLLEQTQLLFQNRSHTKLTTTGVSYILKKYVEQGKQLNQEMFNIAVSPHLLRSTKASHLVQGGANIFYVRDFLGHNSVVTTERYAKNNPEVVREAIKNASANLFVNADFYDKNEKFAMLEFLKTLQ